MSEEKYNEEDLFNFEEVVDMFNDEKETGMKPSKEFLEVILVVAGTFLDKYGENDEKAIILVKMYKGYERELKKKKFFGLF